MKKACNFYFSFDEVTYRSNVPDPQSHREQICKPANRQRVILRPYVRRRNQEKRKREKRKEKKREEKRRERYTTVDNQQLLTHPKNPRMAI